ncbi:hypothetical protein SISNIDRAFT_322185 [Sistotremastrum niveocremeum HHB9708]|uniref:F-box domain-containing protein n=2 Tax=Sistotremastraceae TaxID=3402574 RepID=A0A164MX49_9AGAM|nr:hypothetical protein SISNIDRAFT_322185 [Sistotremastrum niveocremeum HHB9708]KZT32809.1 hypothetical protein SISSUDRAFT_485055 [Sistotremastrum suecicum HHB10207 ss-3]
MALKALVLQLPVEVFREILRHYFGDIKTTLLRELGARANPRTDSWYSIHWYRILHVCGAWREVALDCSDIWDFMDTSWPSVVRNDLVSKAGGHPPRFLIHLAEGNGSSPFYAIDQSYPSKDILPMLENLNITLINNRESRSLASAWDTFCRRHLCRPAPRLKHLHLEVIGPGYGVDFPITTPEQMLGDGSPLTAVVLRNISPRFLLSRTNLTDLTNLEFTFASQDGREFFSLEVIQIISMAPRLETLIVDIKHYSPSRSDATFARRSERVIAQSLKEISLEWWPSNHLEYLMSCMDLPRNEHFKSSLYPNVSPQTYGWMNDAPVDLQNLASQCRSIYCFYDPHAIHIFHAPLRDPSGPRHETTHRLQLHVPRHFRPS